MFDDTCSVQRLSERELDVLLVGAMFLMGSARRCKNPHLRASAVDLLDALCPKLASERAGLPDTTCSLSRYCCTNTP